MALQIGTAAPAMTKAWAEFASTASFADLPPPLMEAAKSIIADAVATMLGASGLNRGCRLVQQIAATGTSEGESTLIGYGRRAPVLLAAMVNGATAHALNYDSFANRGWHVDLGVASVPGPLCVAERGGVSGRQLLTAVVIAGELAARLAESVDLGPDRPKQFTEGQLFGYFAAAAGAGHVLGLTPAQMESALGFAFMQAGGGGQPAAEGKESKELYSGLFNYGGVLSAILAAEGVDAACQAFEGDRGLFQAFFRGEYRPAALLDGLGSEFRVLETQLKEWPTAGPMLAVVEAAKGSRSNPGFSADAIDHVIVRALPRFRTWAEPVEERRHPANLGVATNSLHFAVAATLVTGSFMLGNLTDQGLVREDVIRLTEACEFVPMESGASSGTLEVAFKNGTTQTVPVSMSRKSWIPPVSAGPMQAKLRDCAGHAGAPLLDETIERLLDVLDHLEELDDMRTLTDLLA